MVTMSLKACLCSSELAFHNSMHCFWDLRLSPSKKAWILAFHTISDSRFFLPQPCGKLFHISCSQRLVSRCSFGSGSFACWSCAFYCAISCFCLNCSVYGLLAFQHAKQQPITGLLLSWVISSEQRMQWVAFAPGSFKHLLFRET